MDSIIDSINRKLDKYKKVLSIQGARIVKEFGFQYHENQHVDRSLWYQSLKNLYEYIAESRTTFETKLGKELTHSIIPMIIEKNQKDWSAEESELINLLQTQIFDAEGNLINPHSVDVLSDAQLSTLIHDPIILRGLNLIAGSNFLMRYLHNREMNTFFRQEDGKSTLNSIKSQLFDQNVNHPSVVGHIYEHDIWSMFNENQIHHIFKIKEVNLPAIENLISPKNLNSDSCFIGLMGDIYKWVDFKNKFCQDPVKKLIYDEYFISQVVYYPMYCDALKNIALKVLKNSEKDAKAELDPQKIFKTMDRCAMIIKTHGFIPWSDRWYSGGQHLPASECMYYLVSKMLAGVKSFDPNKKIPEVKTLINHAYRVFYELGKRGMFYFDNQFDLDRDLDKFQPHLNLNRLAPLVETPKIDNAELEIRKKLLSKRLEIFIEICKNMQKNDKNLLYVQNFDEIIFENKELLPIALAEVKEIFLKPSLFHNEAVANDPKYISYQQTFSKKAYSYLLDALGGQLTYLGPYFINGVIPLNTARNGIVQGKNNLNSFLLIWRLFLEINYMISKYIHLGGPNSCDAFEENLSKIALEILSDVQPSSSSSEIREFIQQCEATYHQNNVNYCQVHKIKSSDKISELERVKDMVNKGNNGLKNAFEIILSLYPLKKWVDLFLSKESTSKADKTVYSYLKKIKAEALKEHLFIPLNSDFIVFFKVYTSLIHFYRTHHFYMPATEPDFYYPIVDNSGEPLYLDLSWYKGLHNEEYSDYLIRKFAAQPEDTNAIIEFFNNIKEYQNHLISEMLRLNKQKKDLQKIFLKNGKIGYKNCYNYIDKQYNKILEEPNNTEFFERTRRAAFFKPYFIVKGQLSRYKDLTTIIEFFRDNSNEVCNKLLLDDLPDNTIEALMNVLEKQKELEKTDKDEKNKTVSKNLILNYCRQLKNIILSNTMIEGIDVNSQLKEYIGNMDHSKLFNLIVKSFKDNSKEINLIEVPKHLANIYISIVRRSATTQFKKYIKAKTLSNKGGINLWVWEYINSKQGNLNEKDFKEWMLCSLVDKLKIGKLGESIFSLKKDLIEQYIKSYRGHYCASNISELIKELTIKETKELMAKENILKSIIHPIYERIAINSVDINGCRNYIKKKVQYKCREILSEYLKSNNDFGNIIKTILGMIGNNIWDYIKTPEVHGYSFPIIDHEVIWKIQNLIFKKNATNKVSSVIIPFKPYKVEKNTNLVLSKKVLSRFHLQTEEEIKNFLSLVPTLQYKNGVVIINQPFMKKVVKSPIRFEDIEKRTMGIDLGLKHYATISIMGEQNREIARYFLKDKSILAMRFSTATGRFERIVRPHEHQIIENIGKKGDDTLKQMQRFAEGTNIKNKLKNLMKMISSLQSLKSQAEKINNEKKMKKYKRLISLHWNKVKNIHMEIVHKLSHTILEIAKYHNVSEINFEDLKWSHHSSKKKVGVWLSHKQVHWFFSQIIEHVKQAAKREGFNCNLVFAAYTSKICSKCISTKNSFKFFKEQSLNRGQLKCLVDQHKWVRSGKRFTCSVHSVIDADLNAGRNIAMIKPKKNSAISK